MKAKKGTTEDNEVTCSQYIFDSSNYRKNLIFLSIDNSDGVNRYIQRLSVNKNH